MSEVGSRSKSCRASFARSTAIGSPSATWTTRSRRSATSSSGCPSAQMADVPPSVIGANFAPARHGTVFTVELDGESVLLDEDRNRLHHLNHTATLLWLLFDGETSLDQLADELSAELGVPKGTVLADALAVTRHLGDEGLLG